MTPHHHHHLLNKVSLLWGLHYSTRIIIICRGIFLGCSEIYYCKMLCHVPMLDSFSDLLYVCSCTIYLLPQKFTAVLIEKVQCNKDLWIFKVNNWYLVWPYTELEGELFLWNLFLCYIHNLSSRNILKLFLVYS